MACARVQMYTGRRPGAGGIGEGFYGGGGGGVLVEEGGVEGRQGRFKASDGEGYGGGAGTSATSGLVLLEIVDSFMN
jgi:hypothetical protein